MYKTNMVDISTARKELSKILDRVFLNNEAFVIAKRNIPIAEISRISDKKIKSSRKKTLDLSLFGLLKEDKRTASAIAKDLRKKTWRRNAC